MLRKSLIARRFFTSLNSPQSPQENIARLITASRKLDWRIGRVCSVSNHPTNDQLFVQRLNFGRTTENHEKNNLVEKNHHEDGERQIVSGLRPYFASGQELMQHHEMQVVFCNLKATKFRGVLSQGMVLCSVLSEKDDAKNNVQLMPLRVPEGAQAGDCVWLAENLAENHVPHMDIGVIDPRKKGNPWLELQPWLRVDDDGRVGIPGSAWRYRSRTGWIHVDPRFSGASIH